MANTLDVKITADVVDLQTKFAIARAEVNGLTAEMNKLARASAAGMIDPAGTARLRQVAGDLIHARGEAGVLAGSLERAGVSFGSMGARAAESHISVGMASREFRALSTELSRGEFGRSPITIARLAHSLFQVAPATMIAVGAVAGLAATLAYLVYQSIAAANALDKANIGAAFAGNLELTGTKLKAFTDQLAAAPGVSTKAAQKIIEDLTRIPNLSAPALDALVNLMPSLTSALGLAADKGGEAVKKFLDPKVSAEHLVGEIRAMGGQITEAQRTAAEAADKTGNAYEIQAVKLQLLAAVTEKTATAQIASNSRVTSSWTNYFATIGLAEQGLNAESEFLAANSKEWTAHTAAMTADIAEAAKRQEMPEMKVQAGVEIAKKENPLSEQIDTARTKVEQLTTDLAAAKAIGSPDVTLLTTGLAAAQEKLNALQFGPVLERMRTQMQQVAATWDGTQTGMLVKQRAVAEDALVEVRKSLGGQAAASKDYLSVQQEVARLDVEIRRSTANEIIANARRVNLEISGDETRSTVERLSAEKATWTAVLADARISGNQRVEVEREVASSTAAVNRAAEAERLAIARSTVDTDIRISRMTIDAAKQSLDEELQLHQINAAQKLEILTNLTTQEAQLDIERLNDELASLNPLTARYAEVYNQIREMKAKLTLDLAALDRQAAADAAREAQQQATAWKSAIGEIEGAETTMLGDLLSKRKTFAQAAMAAAAQLATKEIEDDVRAMTTRLLIKETALAKERALEQGGVLYHVVMEHLGTAATAQSQAAQTAAVAAGGQARVAAEAAASAESKGVQAAAAGPQVMSDAARGAAGAFAALAGIPIIGPVLGAIAAGVTFTAIAAYEGMATSLDVGAWNVPRDMDAHIHKGEMVVPRPYAEGMRAAGGEGGASRGGDRYGDTNVSAHFHQAMPSTEAIMAHIRRAVRNAHPATLQQR